MGFCCKIRRIRSLKTFFILSLVVTLMCLIFFVSEEKWFINPGLTAALDKAYNNYFVNAARLKEMRLIVNTSHCKIPDFDPWDKEIIPLIKIAQPLENCLETSYAWSRMDYDILVMNVDAIRKDGYSFNNKLSCCYKTITRENGPNLVEKKKADNSVSYSSCISISHSETQIHTEFILVECYSWYFHLVYRAWHGIATMKRNLRKTTIQEKIDFWQQHKAKKDYDNNSNERPPNILVVGLDSTSRINFNRNMQQTKELLESLDAVEMFGYTKVGENTFPNYCPMFNGYSEEEIFKICLPNYMEYQDSCPLIWKQFDSGHFLTAHTEDGPDFTGFNYLKAGFAQQPVDFYARPLFLSGHDYALPFTLNLIRGDHIDCLGYQSNDEAIVTYLESTLNFAQKNNAPIFSFSWSTTLSHDNFNMIQLVDKTYFDFLTNLNIKGYLNDTILFFMGDHGYRFGPIRETLIGYYEDKLPNLWIRLPPRIKEKYPDWQNNLEINSRRLTSPYHFYWTMNHIIENFTVKLSPPQSAKDLKTGKIIERKYSQNFFKEPVPEWNSCSSIGIPQRYCACAQPESLSLDDTKLQESAEKAVQKINADLFQSKSKSNCATLSVEKITAGAKIERDEGILRYIVGFVTFPGQFLIEAEVDFFVNNETFSSVPPNVQRASKINQKDIKCVTDLKIELFCYCESK